MSSKRRESAPVAYEWSDTVPSPSLRDRIVRTPEPVNTSAAPLQPISIVFNTALPLPAVTVLDDSSGWAEFQAAVQRQERSR